MICKFLEALRNVDNATILDNINEWHNMISLTAHNHQTDRRSDSMQGTHTDRQIDQIKHYVSIYLVFFFILFAYECMCCLSKNKQQINKKRKNVRKRRTTTKDINMNINININININGTTSSRPQNRQLTTINCWFINQMNWIKTMASNDINWQRCLMIAMSAADITIKPFN